MFEGSYKIYIKYFITWFWVIMKTSFYWLKYQKKSEENQKKIRRKLEEVKKIRRKLEETKEIRRKLEENQKKVKRNKKKLEGFFGFLGLGLSKVLGLTPQEISRLLYTVFVY